LLNYFHEYAILLHSNFSVLTVDRVSPLGGKRSDGRRKHHLREMRQPSAMAADDSGPVIGKWRLNCTIYYNNYGSKVEVTRDYFLTPYRKFENQLTRVRRVWTLIKFSVWSQKICGNLRKTTF
jgi:hypothetical protein